jgi:hemerythrin
LAVYWRQDLIQIGIESIDQHHQQMLDLLGKFHSSFNTNLEEERFKMIIDFIDNHTVPTFKNEEQLMKKHHYPNFEEHQHEHRLFLDNYKELKKEFKKKGVNKQLFLTMYRTISQLLTEHISRADQSMGSYLKDRLA